MVLDNKRPIGIKGDKFYAFMALVEIDDMLDITGDNRDLNYIS